MRAPSDDWTSLRPSFYSLILLTWYCQYRSLTEKNHTFLCGFWVVCFLVSPSRTSYTYRTLYIHRWNHLLDFLNVMDLSTFSCNHVFLSNRTQTVQSAMSKRRQETSSDESGSPAAKPEPRSMNLVTMKPRLISLLSREARMSSDFSSQEKSDSENLRSVEVGKDRAGIGIWKQMASTSPYPAEQSQVWKPESIQERKREDFGKTEQKSASSSTTCT